MPDNGIDLLIGTGAAPEGVITAAAIRCLGGEFQGQLRWRSEEEKERAKKMGTDISETKTLSGGRFSQRQRHVCCYRCDDW
jgi:fructose-1,6-bisphosphatase/sedoheptulose 1,7-bisphosphatase-like protein